MDATTWRPVGRGVFEGSLTADWYQGRGVFGGVVAGAILRSVVTLVDDAARVPRSLTVHFCAPARQGAAVVRAQVEMRGSQVSHASARLEQDGAPVAFAAVTLAASRTGALAYQDVEMPAGEPFEAAHTIADNPLMPVFARHFEYRLARGIPFSASEHSLLQLWLRPVPPLVLDAALAVALLDAPPPAVFTRLSAPAAAVSVDLSVHFFADMRPGGVPADAPWLISTASRWAAAGFTDQVSELWSQDGRLMARCQQLVAVRT